MNMFKDSDKNELVVVFMAQLPITQHIRFGLMPCPSGHCSLRSQRRIRWKRYMTFRPPKK